MHPEFIFHILGYELTVRAYPLFAILAAAAAFVISFTMLKKNGWKIHQTTILYISCALFFLAGARILNFAVNYANYKNDGYSVFTLAFGHFSVYGGMALACLPPVLLAKVWRKSFWFLADTMVFPFASAFAIMRIGCFLNGCCYGQVCDVFWGVPAPNTLVRIYDSVNSLLPSLARPHAVLKVYPTQLMEMGFALLFLPLGVWLYKKYRGRGVVISAFIIYFAAFRLFVLFFRELPYSDIVTVYVYPAVYIVCILTGILMLLYNLHRNGTEKGNKKA